MEAVLLPCVQLTDLLRDNSYVSGEGNATDSSLSHGSTVITSAVQEMPISQAGQVMPL
jgi:hypothetical protein